MLRNLLRRTSQQWGCNRMISTLASRVDEKNGIDESITCLTLHPVVWPNHGAAIELSLASEALGLVRSLDWEIR